MSDARERGEGPELEVPPPRVPAGEPPELAAFLPGQPDLPNGLESGRFAYGPGLLTAAHRPTRWPRQAEIRWAVVVVVALALVGVAGGALWVGVAPRQPFTVVRVGQAIRATPEGEVFIAADGWYVFITLGIGLLAGALAWLPRSGRGVLMPVALAAGGAAGALATWAFGEWLTPDIRPRLQHVGSTLLFPIQLRAEAAVVVEAFAAVVVYMILAGFADRDDLGNPGGANHDVPGPGWLSPPPAGGGAPTVGPGE